MMRVAPRVEFQILIKIRHGFLGLCELEMAFAALLVGIGQNALRWFHHYHLREILHRLGVHTQG